MFKTSAPVKAHRYTIACPLTWLFRIRYTVISAIFNDSAGSSYLALHVTWVYDWTRMQFPSVSFRFCFAGNAANSLMLMLIHDSSCVICSTQQNAAYSIYGRRVLGHKRFCDGHTSVQLSLALGGAQCHKSCLTQTTEYKCKNRTHSLLLWRQLFLRPYVKEQTMKNRPGQPCL